MRRSAPLLLLSGVMLATMLACQLSLPKSSAPLVATPTSPAHPNAAPNEPSVSGQQAELTALYDRVNGGVVSIQVITDQGGGQASGFVFDKQGHIVTNLHVVDGATQIEVDFPSGVKVYGKTVGTDSDSDIAVLKVDVPADQLTVLPLGSGSALRVGQTVVAIGNPFGLNGTMTLGIVSAKDRTMDSLHETASGGFFSSGAVIQTDAAINPGNSGGPLLNLDGEVVGINRAIRTDTTNASGDPLNSGISFAVNVDIVKRVVPVLIQSGHYDYPYLGISFMPDISLMAKDALKLPQATGAYVTDVVANGPAAQAGIKAGSSTNGQVTGGGDLVIAVDGQPVRVFGDLITYLMTQKSPGDKVVFTILRGSDRKEVTVTLGKRP